MSEIENTINWWWERARGGSGEEGRGEKRLTAGDSESDFGLLNSSPCGRNWFATLEQGKRQKSRDGRGERGSRGAVSGVLVDRYLKQRRRVCPSVSLVC